MSDLNEQNNTLLRNAAKLKSLIDRKKSHRIVFIMKRPKPRLLTKKEDS